LRQSGLGRDQITGRPLALHDSLAQSQGQLAVAALAKGWFQQKGGHGLRLLI
jgi:hypothetical protein